MATEDVIKEAWRLVTEADLPKELQETAFREVLRSMLSGSEPAGKPRFSPRNMSLGIQSDESGDVEVDEAEVFAKVEHGTGVTADQLERLVMLDGGVIKVILAAKDLGKNTADAARAVAQIITVVGAYGLDRNDTEYEVIRDECVRLKVYDSKNFASKHLTAIDGFVTKGSGANRRLEAKTVGFKNFPNLVNKLVGEA